MPYPPGSLVPESGEICSQIFMDLDHGHPAWLSWQFVFGFGPIRVGDEELRPSLVCNYVPWPIRDWRDLEGRSIEVCCGETLGGVVGAFFDREDDAEEHPASHVKLTVTGRRGMFFHCVIEMTVGHARHVAGNKTPEITIRAERDLPFTGVTLIPSGLTPIPQSEEELLAVAGSLVDLSLYQKPEPWPGKASPDSTVPPELAEILSAARTSTERLFSQFVPDSPWGLAAFILKPIPDEKQGPARWTAGA